MWVAFLNRVFTQIFVQIEQVHKIAMPIGHMFLIQCVYGFEYANARNRKVKKLCEQWKDMQYFLSVLILD